MSLSRSDIDTAIPGPKEKGESPTGRVSQQLLPRRK
jgi:hypothetical protein